MGWHNVEKLLEQVAAHSTLSGKFWITFFYVMRFLIVMAIAGGVFGDEQSNFKCNTLTPGCPNICFNDFSPISMVRLWSLQLLSVAIPAVIFIVYTIHKLDKIAQAKKKKAEIVAKREKQKAAKKLLREKIRQRRIAEGLIPDTPAPPEYNGDKKKEEKKDDDGKVVATKLDGEQPSILLLCYVGQVVIRLIAEVVFMWVQYHTYVYKFWVPEIFKCARYPCKNVVDCFVSRPKEKTIIVWIMYSTGILMVFLNIIELYHIGAEKIWNAWKNRHYDITKIYRVGSSSEPQFRNARWNTGYPQAVGIPMYPQVIPIDSDEYHSDSA